MPNTIPLFDFASRAQITRKTLERLACFSKMQSSSSESSSLLDKTLTKINGFVKLLDSSILTAEFAYEFATAMLGCDKENKEQVGKTMKNLSSLASKGSVLAQEVATGFKGIEQAIYKIAASTKDSTLAIHIPPDSTAQTKTVHKNLKDVGTDLVANLKLFSQFSLAAEEIAEWWAFAKELVSEMPTLPQISTSESGPGETDEQFVLWSNMKENLWEYYTTINVAQHMFLDSLGPSIAAWQPAASARGVSDLKIEETHQEKPTPKRGKSIGQLLSRFLEKRTRDVKVGAMPDSEGEKTTGASGASDSVPIQQTPNKTGKIQTLLTACISAGPICKCL